MSDYRRECPKCGSDYYSIGKEIADYCTECKTLFKKNADKWTIEELNDPLTE